MVDRIQLLIGDGRLVDGARLPSERDLAERLSISRSKLIITTGALSGLNLIARCLLDPGDRVSVKSPTYPNGLDTLRRHHARLVPAPMTDGGWNVEAISSAVRQLAPKLPM